MIAYRRQGDGTYRKEGEFAAVPAEVRIKVGDARPFSGAYTLAQATAIIEDAIKKGQVQKDAYYILPMEEAAPKAPKPSKLDSFVATEDQATRIAKIQETTVGSRADAIKQMLKEDKDAAKASAKSEKKAAKEAKKAERAAAKAAQPPKQPKSKKYNSEDFVRIFKETFATTQDSSKSLDAVCEQTKASRVWAQRVLVKLGAWVKQERATKPEVVLTEVEEARISAILASPDAPQGLDRKQAIKQLRKEQRIAARPPKASKAPRQNKYSQDDFVSIYQASNNSLEAVLVQTGASRVWVQRVLVRRGVWVKPVAVQAAAPCEPICASPISPLAAEPTKKGSALTDAEEATVVALMAEHKINRGAAIKRMRRAAEKARK